MVQASSIRVQPHPISFMTVSLRAWKNFSWWQLAV